MICKKCGWHLDDAISKSICQDCKVPLHFMRGTKEEIEKKTAEIMKNIKV